jgi:hypothetical protein
MVVRPILDRRDRFLTIAQFARIAGFSVYHSAEVLRGLERWGLIGWFGFVGIPGQGKAPKVYYLRRKDLTYCVLKRAFLRIRWSRLVMCRRRGRRICTTVCGSLMS